MNQWKWIFRMREVRTLKINFNGRNMNNALQTKVWKKNWNVEKMFQLHSHTQSEHNRYMVLSAMDEKEFGPWLGLNFNEITPFSQQRTPIHYVLYVSILFVVIFQHSRHLFAFIMISILFGTRNSTEISLQMIQLARCDGKTSPNKMES